MTATVAGMREILQAQTRLVDACLHCLQLSRTGERPLAAGDPEVVDVVLTMAHMVGISGHSILRLTEEVSLHVRDAYPIARSIVEGVVNVLFIMAKGRDMAARAKRHAEQKAFRDLHRTWQAGETTMAVQRIVELTPGERSRLEALAAEFAWRNGREKDWTDENIAERLAAIAATFPRSSHIILSAATFNIYRHASEVVHGTYFAAMHFWGIGGGRGRPTNGDQMRLLVLDHQFAVLMSATFAFTALVECVAAYIGESGLKELAGKQLDRLRALPAVAEALLSSDGPAPSP
ncbi:DUF5677 domain-containing protein [Roseomonas sp. CAU 1739]